MKKQALFAGATAVIAIALYGLNASWLAPAPTSKPRLLSHRGVYQHYDRTGLTTQTCTATRIFKPTHDLLENTLPSMQMARDYGADAIELDVHPTRDGDFAVFHDWTLDCRTDGHGNTRAHTMAELKALDIGYGYTYDGGKTLPFRGRFKGRMPSLKEAIETFPDTHFLINVKSNNPHEAEWLDLWLKRHPEIDTSRLTVYGGDRPMARLAQLRPGLQPAGKAIMKDCALSYLALGWSGYMPRACRNITLFLPQNYAWLAWGYPNRLQDRFARAGSYIYLVGPRHKGVNDSLGIMTQADVRRLPAHWGMGIMTDAIETVGPAFRAKTADRTPEAIR